MRGSGSRRAIGTILLVLGLAGGCAQRGPAIEKLDVTVTVLVDGSADVEERLQVRFDGGERSFRRHVPVWHHDGVFDVSPASGLSATKGPALDATWTFPPASAGSRQFVLRYRAAGAVAVSGINGGLSWRLFPGARGYDIHQAHVRVILPPGAVLLDDPWVDEAGWEVKRLADGLEASRTGIARSESGTAGVSFTVDTMAAGQPSWQFFQRRAADLMPAFITTGLCIIVIGLGILALIRFKFPTLRAQRESGAPPAVRDALREALARGRPYGYALDDLIDAGLVDRERVNLVRDLRRAGIATVLFGIAAGVFTARWLSRFDVWPYAIPLSLLCCGLLFLMDARRFPVLSQMGVNARERVLYSARVPDGRTSA